MVKDKISTEWYPNLAYAIGLLVTDGNLSKDGRHIDLTSKDIEQLDNFNKSLGIQKKISQKKSGLGNVSSRIQFSNTKFYLFLVSIGITPNKSKTIGKIDVPDEYFFDFLRGHFDGDGSFYSYKDKRWKNSVMYYLCFTSASKDHIFWIRDKIFELCGARGSLVKSKGNTAYQLKYAKKETLILVGKLYYNNRVLCLNRKAQNIKNTICAGGEMVYTYA